MARRTPQRSECAVFGGRNGQDGAFEASSRQRRTVALRGTLCARVLCRCRCGRRCTEHRRLRLRHVKSDELLLLLDRLHCPAALRYHVKQLNGPVDDHATFHGMTPSPCNTAAHLPSTAGSWPAVKYASHYCVAPLNLGWIRNSQNKFTLIYAWAYCPRIQLKVENQSGPGDAIPSLADTQGEA